MRPIIAARDLSKRYGARQVLAGASLEVKPGELVAVLGPSGSGKTTLFRCLTRLTEPDSGSVEIDGEAIDRLKGRGLARARRKVGVVFQQFNLVRRITALDNVLAGRLADAPLWRVLAGTFSAEDEQRAFEALHAVGLLEHAHQRADTLSGGQQQRVAIARALAQESRILLADEPVASVDPETALSILGLMHRLTRASGLAVLCTLHQPQLAARFADRVLIMEDGRIKPGQATILAETKVR